VVCVPSAFVLQRRGRRPTEISNDAKLASVPVHKFACKAKHNHQLTLQDKLLDDFLQSGTTEPSSDIFLTSALRWEGLQNIIGDLEAKHEHLWFSLFAQPGHVLWRRESIASDPEGLIIGSTDHAVVVLHLRVLCHKQQMYCKLDVRKGFSSKILTLEDPKEWLSLPATIVSRLPDSGASSPKGLVLALSRKPAPLSLWKVNARFGFKRLTVDRMISMLEYNDADSSIRVG